MVDEVECPGMELIRLNPEMVIVDVDMSESGGTPGTRMTFQRARKRNAGYVSNARGVAAEYQVRRFLADHDDRCVGVASHDRLHDRGVNDTSTYSPRSPCTFVAVFRPLARRDIRRARGVKLAVRTAIVEQ